MSSGWRGESQRHGMSARGLKSGNLRNKVFKKSNDIKSSELENKNKLYEENWKESGYRKDYLVDTPRKKWAVYILSDAQEANERDIIDLRDAYVDNSLYQFSKSMDKDNPKDVEIYNRIKGLKNTTGYKFDDECNYIKKEVFEEQEKAYENVKVGDKVVWYSAGKRHINKVLEIKGDNRYYLLIDYPDSHPESKGNLTIRKDFIESVKK
jgi:hypothetical protein